MTPFERAASLLTEHRLDEALEGFEQILESEPAHVDALYHASLVHAARQRYEPALAHAIRAAELRPDWWRGPAQAGALLLVMERAAEALRYLQLAATLHPQSAEVFNNIGCAQRALGLRADALTSFERASGLAPNDVDIACNLADAYTTCEKYEDCIAALERLVEGGVENANLYSVLGKAVWKLDRLDEALEWFDRALALDPRCATALGRRGNVLFERGDIAGGVRSLRAAIEAEPRRAEFYRMLAEVDPSKITNAELELLKELPGSDAAFAVGRVLEARGERKAAFQYLRSGNAGVRAELTYDEAAMLSGFERLATIFSAERLRVEAPGNPSDRPVFIVGMPRSGTTLIEQIIASHPNVYGAGETPLIAHISDATIKAAGIGAEAVVDHPTVVREIGDAYLAAIAELAPNEALRVTDKMPDNFRALGLIALALPNAKIIHARRDPLDTCLSCFSFTFESGALAWTYDLGELGRYYRAYAKIMTHWHNVLPPGKILDVQYEDVVEDLEGQARRIVSFCGLPWDDACLAFYENKRPVKTASVAQVRKPIYRSSVNRAEGYGELLQPLIDELLANDRR